MQELCLIMFSGGRDSTIAAVRMANSKRKLSLVTVTSDHLKGISAVKERLIELKRYLSGDTNWILVSDSNLTAPVLSIAPKTCLPCFLKYNSLGVMLARKLGASYLAFGFTGYQSSWPEQAPYAVDKLAEVLSDLGIHLEIPVYDIKTKNEVTRELQRLGLSISALEQKCTRQTMNEEIPSELLEKAIDEWTSALRLAVSSNLALDINIISCYKLDDIMEIS